MNYTFELIDTLAQYFTAISNLDIAVKEMKVEQPTNQYVKLAAFNKLKKTCYNYANQTNDYPNSIIDNLGNELTQEINKRNFDENVILYKQIFDLINRVLIKFNLKVKNGGFNTQLLTIKTLDGIEKEITADSLAEDLKSKLMMCQEEIILRFKFLNLEEHFKPIREEKERQINLKTQKAIEQNIFYFKETKWNIPFRNLHHTILTVCNLVKPIYPSIDPLKYFEYFFRHIDFHKIDDCTKEETLKYCNAIYYGLELLLKVDINKAIQNYQSNIKLLTKEQASEAQVKLIELIGLLKQGTRSSKLPMSFTQRYSILIKQIIAKEKLLPIDYQILIMEFEIATADELLIGFEIIKEQIQEITPFLKTFDKIEHNLPMNENETKREQMKSHQTKSRLDFTKDKLKSTLLELASMNGYENPSTYLDEILNYVKLFNDIDFERNFFLNIHHLCQENADKFWSETHKKDISSWLKKAPFSPIKITPDKTKNLFDTTWESSLLPVEQLEKELKQENPNDFILKYLSEFKNEFNCDADYLKVINLVSLFFLSKKIIIKEPIFVKSGNIKNIAFAMGEIWRCQKNDIITFEYLNFNKQVFSIFNKQEIDENNLFGANLYKYSISKT